ncbi:MAG: tRNA-queuosine alpha-mannosyltransferase domain-containing protein [Planctomycetota bacterium]
MRILAIEPYYGGSHKAFLDGWAGRSRHDFTLLALPPYFWKWRMRHAAITLAGQVRRRIDEGNGWDLLFCSDMLSLAEFKGLAPRPVSDLPSVVYFHENQLTYPARHSDVRDVHFVVTNLTTALAADAIWWNSAYHRDDFLTALSDWCRKLPDHPPADAVGRIGSRSQVHWPGIEPAPVRGDRLPGPFRILYAARWEHDKQPEVFFAGIEKLAAGGRAFRLDVLGESFSQVPEVYQQVRGRLADHIDQWGYAKSQEAYRQILQRADVVVSTARHEFFGLSVAEAVAAGAWPVVPEKLAYPELLADLDGQEKSGMFTPADPDALAGRLGQLARRLDERGRLYDDPAQPVGAMARYAWPKRAAELDDAAEAVERQ